MSEEIKKEEQEVVQPDVNEQLKNVMNELNSLKSELTNVKTENETYKKTIETMDENLAKQLDALNTPKSKDEDVEKTEEPKKQLDGQNIFDNLMGIRQEQNKKLEEEREKQAQAKVLEENTQLKFKIGVKDLIENEPYLQDFIKEGINEKRFKTIEDVQMGLTPSVKKALQYTWKKSEELKKAGRDPMEMYSTIGEATNEEVRAEKRRKNVENWAKKLSR